MASNGSRLVSEELEIVLKEVILVEFELTSQHFSGTTKKIDSRKSG
jgi:hypothetical protein